MWLHRSKRAGTPARFPLADVTCGTYYDGVVTERNYRYGVFVDFGSEKDGLLQLPWNLVSSFYRGMELKDMMVTSCDPETGKVRLLPDEATLPEPKPNSHSRSRSTSMARSESQSSRAVSAGTRGRRRGQSRTRNGTPSFDWGHPDGFPLENIQTGMVTDGVVTISNNCGVFVNFGSTRDGRLSLPLSFQRLFTRGDHIQGCVVSDVDLQQGRVRLTLSDVTTTVKRLYQDKTPLKELEEGLMVDRGVISDVSRYGVFVNIGATRDAKLMGVPRSVKSQMAPGQRVERMRIHRIDLRSQRISLVFDEDEEPAASPPAAAPAEVRAEAGAGRTAEGETAQAPPASPGRVPLAEIRIGEVATGEVTSIGPHGVMVDIGAEVPGTLYLSDDVRRLFRTGDLVEGMVVDGLDLRRRWVSLAMEDPELDVVDSREDAPQPQQPPVSRARRGEPSAARAKPKAAPEPGSQALAASPAPSPKPKLRQKAHAAGPGAKAAARAKPKGQPQMSVALR